MSKWPGISPKDLAFVTTSQVRRLFWCERDEHGAPKWMEGQKATYEDLFQVTWKARGANEDQVKALWVAFVAHEGRPNATREEWMTTVDGIMGWKRKASTLE